MKTLSYSKMFLTGTLAGLSVRCSYKVPASVLAARMEELNWFTPANPGHDCITKAAFWVYQTSESEEGELMTFRIYFPKTDHAVFASWNGPGARLELNHGLPDVFPKISETLLQALQRAYPNAQIEEVR